MCSFSCQLSVARTGELGPPRGLLATPLVQTSPRCFWQNVATSGKAREPNPVAPHDDLPRRFLTLLLPTAGLAAQTVLSDLRLKDGVEVDVTGHSAPTFGDLDGDGRRDLVVGEGLGVRIYQALPGAQFASRMFVSLVSQNVSAVNLSDRDGDGDLDIYSRRRGTHASPTSTATVTPTSCWRAPAEEDSCATTAPVTSQT